MGKKQSTGRPSSYTTKGDYARQLRDQLGLSQVELATNCDLSQRTIREVETGAGGSADTLRRVAEHLGLSNWHDLLADEERSRFSRDPGVPPSVVPIPTPVSSPSGASRLFQLPSVVADFTGREDEFRRMVERLCGEGGRVGLSALRGMGGVGKTSLAVKVAREVEDRFPDARLFLDLQGMSEQPMTAAEAMARLIRDFSPEAKLPDGEAELLPIYRSVLAGKRALILLDNARDEIQVKNLVTAPPPVGFIITSRIALALDGVESIRLDMLPPGEALSLLRGIVGAKGTDDELCTVAEMCGLLPLALRVAGDFLRLKDDWTTAQYITALNAERLRWLKIGNTPEKDVEAVLKFSSAQLVQDNLDLAERWHLLHVFPTDFDVSAAAAFWDRSPDDPEVHNDLSNLTNRSLILFEAVTSRYRLHDLMKPIAEKLFGLGGLR